MFSGSYVAIVTPWNDDGSKVDFDCLKELIEFQLENGIDGIVPCGTTGESATLTHSEQMDVVRCTVETVAGRCKVVAGAGSNATAEAIKLSVHAKDVGADGILVITPYYNRPTPDGLVAHFAAVAEACDLPMMLYNVPSRTGTNMLPPTVARSFNEIDSVVCVKEASGSLDQASQIRQLCDIGIMSGDDSLTLPLMAVGGAGVVSVAANIVPGIVKEMVDAAAAGDYARAREVHYRLLPILKVMFVETNPIPVKTALKLMGRINGNVRLPLCELRPESLCMLKNTLSEFGLI